MKSLSAILALAMITAACSGSDDSASTGDAEGPVVLLTHDSFAVSDGLFDEFTAETGIEVQVLRGGDAGELVSKAILSSGSPEADVLFGIDNTFLQRGLDAALFEAYESPALDNVSEDLILDDKHRVTPIDVGDVCVNYWIDGVGANPPSSLDDLAANADLFVTQSPESSSPGFAFLLATIARYGEDGWEGYWRSLVDGGVEITSGWEEAYFGSFVAGGGDRTFVTSYATSPVAAVIFADPPTDKAPTGVLTDSCFRQIEFAGILAGTDKPDGAAKLIDFLLSDTFQSDIPLNMFVAPASNTAPLPEAFTQHRVVVENPLTMTPKEIEAGRLDWTERWNEIVLQS